MRGQSNLISWYALVVYILYIVGFYIFFTEYWGIFQDSCEFYLHAHKKIKDPGLFYSVLCTLPLIFSMILTNFAEYFLSESNLIIPENSFLKSNKQILANSVENTFIFIISLNSLIYFDKLDEKKIMLHSICFILSRILYIIGYFFSKIVNFPTFRIPGLGLTMINTYYLIWLNLNYLIEQY